MIFLVFATYCYIVNSIIAMLGYIFGSILAKNHMAKHGLDHTLSFGFLIFLLSSGVLYLISKFFQHHTLFVLLMLIPIFTLALAMAFLLPLGIAGAVTYHAEHRGVASGLISVLSMGATLWTGSMIGWSLQSKAPFPQPDQLWLMVLCLAGVCGFLYYLTKPVR